MTQNHGHRDEPGPRLPAIALAFLLGVCLLHLQADIQLPVWTDACLLAALPLLVWLFYLKPSQRVLLAFLPVTCGHWLLHTVICNTLCLVV